MQRALGVVLACVTGCSFAFARLPHERHLRTGHYDCPSASPIADTIIAIVVGGTGVIGVEVNNCAGNSSCNGNLLALAEAIGAIAVGATYGISATYGWSKRGECKRLEAPPERDENKPSSHAVARARARGTMLRALQAAQAGDCGRVVEFDQLVLEIDREFHDEVFARDVSIVACLAQRAPSK